MGAGEENKIWGRGSCARGGVIGFGAGIPGERCILLLAPELPSISKGVGPYSPRCSGNT